MLHSRIEKKLAFPALKASNDDSGLASPASFRQRPLLEGLHFFPFLSAWGRARLGLGCTEAPVHGIQLSGLCVGRVSAFLNVLSAQGKLVVKNPPANTGDMYPWNFPLKTLAHWLSRVGGSWPMGKSPPFLGTPPLLPAFKINQTFLSTKLASLIALK